MDFSCIKIANFSNIKVSSYQKVVKQTCWILVLPVRQKKKTLTISGTTHSAGHFSTDENTFSNNDQLVTKTIDADDSLADLVDSAPFALDTLNTCNTRSCINCWTSWNIELAACWEQCWTIVDKCKCIIKFIYAELRIWAWR